jgi:hypothetical protein
MATFLKNCNMISIIRDNDDVININNQNKIVTGRKKPHYSNNFIFMK